MIKTYTQVLAEIKQNQIIEMEYKGTLNRSLYILMYDTLGKVCQKIFWKNNNINTFNDTIVTAIDTDVVTKIGVTNNYDDWYINIYTK
jgi:hypothetical protein